MVVNEAAAEAYNTGKGYVTVKAKVSGAAQAAVELFGADIAALHCMSLCCTVNGFRCNASWPSGTWVWHLEVHACTVDLLTCSNGPTCAILTRS